MSYFENQHERFQKNKINNLTLIEKVLLKTNLCIYTYIIDASLKKISHTFSNCTNSYKLDLKKYISENLINDLTNRVVIKNIKTLSNKDIPVFISIRSVPVDNVIVSFAVADDISDIDESHIDNLKNTIMIHEVNLLLKQVYNTVNNFNNQFNILLEFVDKSKKIAIPSLSGLKMKKTSLIMYCIADGNYSFVHYIDDSKDCIFKPLSWLEKRLCCSEDFIKIHKSYIVNNMHISEVKEKHVVMIDGKVFGISVRRKNEFKKRFGII